MTDERLPERPEIRVSHADRDQVAEQLRIAAGDGRLTMEELDERLDRALSARTGSELALLTRDLPAFADGPLADGVEVKDLVRIEVSSASQVRQGRWVLPRAMEIKVGSGSVKLDLTEAVITNPMLKIDAEVRSGSLSIITKPGIEVFVDEVTVRSGSAKVVAPPDPAPGGTPTVLRIEISGSVRSGSVVARPPRGSGQSLFARLAARRRQRAIGG